MCRLVVVGACRIVVVVLFVFVHIVGEWEEVGRWGGSCLGVEGGLMLEEVGTSAVECYLEVEGG